MVSSRERSVESVVVHIACRCPMPGNLAVSSSFSFRSPAIGGVAVATRQIAALLVCLEPRVTISGDNRVLSYKFRRRLAALHPGGLLMACSGGARSSDSEAHFHTCQPSSGDGGRCCRTAGACWWAAPNLPAAAAAMPSPRHIRASAVTCRCRSAAAC